MAYNDTTKQWELETDDETLERLLNAYNSFVQDANMNVNTIKGSGLEGAFYTYIRGYYDLLQSGVLDLQAKMQFAIKEASFQVLRPNVIKDNIVIYAEKKGLELAVFDLNNTKMTGNPEGIYLVVKPVLTLNQQNEIMSDIGKNCVVAGVIMQGTTSIFTTLSTGNQLEVKYTQATQLPFKIKVEIKRKTTSIDAVNLQSEIQQEILNFFQETYKLGVDFNATDIQFILINKFKNLSEIQVYYSLDETEPYTYILGSYVVPYDKFLNVTINDILVEVL
jgi:hypothetical protein